MDQVKRCTEHFYSRWLNVSSYVMARLSQWEY